MHLLLRTNRVQWLMIGLMVISVSACSFAHVASTPSIVEVTRIVPVTQLVQAPPVEVTRIVLAAPMVEVTRLVIVEAPPVEVTRVVLVTQLVEATQIVGPTPIVPAPTAVLPPIVPAPTSVPTLENYDLLVWYDFEGDFLTSGIIADRSGNGFDAQVNGAVDMVQGISGGQAIFFSGDGYILAQSNPVAWRNTVSFSLWFITDDPDANYKLASAAWWDGGAGSGWILATHIPEFWGDNNQGLYLPDIVNEDNHFPVSEWVHEVVTYDGDRIREYTNGQLVNDWPTTGAAIGQGQPMAVGAWPLFSGYNFQGSIDEFLIFSYALTEQEVQEIYNQGR
jgi:Concanavalin A-like lectin/glucanases superfamily